MTMATTGRAAGVAFAVVACACTAQSTDAACELGEPRAQAVLRPALASGDPVALDSAFRTLGLDPAVAPAPETPERVVPFEDIPASVAIGPAQLPQALDRYLVHASAHADELERTSPPNLPSPLRAHADTLLGLTVIAEAVPERRGEARAVAVRLADALVAASGAAGVPYTPFPHWRGRGGRLGELADRATAELEACGGLEAASRGGWLVVGARPDEFLFDTGRVGEAVAAMPADWRSDRHEAWLREAGAWMRGLPPAPNFNYNAFAADLHLGAGEGAEAVRRVRGGVLPGLIADGPDAGRWVDPHNQRLVYRMIMARTLARAGALEDPEIDRALRLALAAIETDLRALGGIAHPEEMIRLYAALDARPEPVAHDATLRAGAERHADLSILDGRAKSQSAVAYRLAHHSTRTR